MQLVFTRCLVALPIALLLSVTPVYAEVEVQAEAEDEAEIEPAPESADWAPPESDYSKMDEVRLKSGETLYGEFEGLRDRKVYFDSDEFDNLDFDWSKVASILLPTPHIFRLDDRDVTGSAELREDLVRVRTSSGEILEFPRTEIVSITQGGEREISYWSGDMGVDFSATQGNTDQIDVSGNVFIKRETALTRWSNTYRGVYAELEGDENTQNHRAETKLDVYLTRRTFLTVPTIEYYRDKFQNIDMRLSSGAALGYEFVKNAMMEWDASIGGSHQYTEFVGGSAGDHDFAAVIESELEIDVTSDIELDSRYKVQVVTTDIDKTSHHFETELSNDIWGPLELDVTFIWDRIEKPVTDDDGDRPDSDDFRLMVGISVDF